MSLILLSPLQSVIKSHFKFRPKSLQSPTPISTKPKPGVIIIGAGLAGLSAATHLASKNIPFTLLESSDAVGGRVRTDIVNGFILDRGFQIFITAYPEAQKVLDYDQLDLKKFYSGAFVYYDGGFHTVADPVRHFFDAIMCLKNPIGSVLDKLLIGLARVKVLTRTNEDIINANEVPIMDLLVRDGFTSSVIDRFFRPFFGGIFFDNELETTSRLFDFIFKCLALGDNTLPAKGICAIPKQLANNLPSGSILLNSKVVSVGVNDMHVTLESGEVFQSELGVIVAVEEPAMERLLGVRETVRERRPRSTVCIYFSADQAPVKEPVLFLNGSGNGIVNNMFFATNVAPSYGPPGKTLVSVSIVGSCEDIMDDDLTMKVIQELSTWFGASVVSSWKHLRTYRIKFAQPNQCPPTNLSKNPKFGPGVYICGDHWNSATFDGAMVSGRRAAEALIEDIAIV